MKLHYWEKQLILYTKLHYGRVDYNKDLKHFAAEYYGLHLDQVKQRSVNHLVITLYEKLVEDGYIHFKLGTFLSDTFKRKWFDDGIDNIGWNDILKQLLSEIQNMAIEGTGLSLGIPDKKILNQIE